MYVREIQNHLQEAGQRLLIILASDSKFAVSYMNNTNLYEPILLAPSITLSSVQQYMSAHVFFQIRTPSKSQEEKLVGIWMYLHF